MRHHGTDIGKVHIDMTSSRDHIRNPLNGLPKDIIGHLEGFEQRRRFVDNTEQSLIRNHEQGIHMAAEVSNPFIRMNHPAMTFVGKRLRYDPDCQDTELTCDTRDDRRGARPGSTAHPRGHKHHVGALKAFPNLIFTFQCRVLSDFRLRPGTESPGPLRTQLNLIGRPRPIQRLQIGICRDKIDPRQSGHDHGVKRVAPGATDTDHFDPNGGHNILFE